jgi:broad specificity phosphatase PhoE
MDVIIYLARHGQTTGDVEKRYGGDYDDHLTVLGRSQSSQLAELLSSEGIEQLFASPRIRAQETAEIIAEKLGLIATTLDGFRERNAYGVLTGLTKKEAKAKYPDQVELLNNAHNTVSGGEEYIPFRQKITSALDDVSRVTADKIAVVTHGGPIRLIFRDILKMGEVDIGDCGFAALEGEMGKYKLLSATGIEFNK